MTAYMAPVLFWKGSWKLGRICYTTSGNVSVQQINGCFGDGLLEFSLGSPDCGD